MFLSELDAIPLPPNPGTPPPAGEAPPGILNLLAFKPARADLLNRFTQAVMRGPSPLTPWQREMIAAIASKGNATPFCMHSHAAATASLLGDPALVRAVLDDFGAAPLSPRERAIFAFARTVTADPRGTTRSDVDAVLAAGWSEEAVHDAITVCALFKFYNTWVSAHGVDELSPGGYAATGARLAAHGYARDESPRIPAHRAVEEPVVMAS